MGDDKMITEVTFEVTIRHFVTESSPNPDELDVEAAMDNWLASQGFDVESIRATRQ